MAGAEVVRPEAKWDMLLMDMSYRVSITADGYAHSHNQRVVDRLWEVGEALRQKYETGSLGSARRD